MLGGRYRYTETPPGFRAQEAFEWARNHCKRLGHFAQGFMSAMIARKILFFLLPYSFRHGIAHDPRRDGLASHGYIGRSETCREDFFNGPFN